MYSLAQWAQLCVYNMSKGLVGKGQAAIAKQELHFVYFDALSKNTKYKIQAAIAKQELHFVHFDPTALSKDDDDAYTSVLRTLRCYVHFNDTYTSML